MRCPDVKLIILTPIPFHTRPTPPLFQELGTFAFSHLVPSRGIPHATEVESVDRVGNFQAE